MKIIRNDKVIKRNNRLAGIGILGGLASVIASIIISINFQELIGWSYAILFVGFVFLQFGLYFMNRYGRKPRPDEALDTGLKGLDDRYTIYHYNSPVPHLLIGPAGIWILIPYFQNGRVTYEKNRWRLRGGGFLAGYMRIFGQEGLGRPDLESAAEVDAMKKFFKKYLPDVEVPEVRKVMIMTSDQAQIDAEDSPIPIVQVKKLKEMIRKNAKKGDIKLEQLQAIKDALPEG
jgi:hypothetical protein